AELPGGIAAPAGAGFVADSGRARLIVVEARGSAFASDRARAFVADVERAAASAKASPGGRDVTIELAGGHAIANATEQMLKRDLAVSGTLSLALASLAFLLTFRRARALVAVLPPLVLGTLWTTGLAALLPSGLTAVAIAFAAVVVGVGVDTGVHVYAALLAARREGLGPRDAAREARARTWRPTLIAAVVSAVAFATLALSGLRAMQQLGLLCGAGEFLTAVAIVLATPEIGAIIERGPPPPALRPRWVHVIQNLTATRRRALIALTASAAPIAIVALIGWPRPAHALVAIRPRTLAPLVAEAHVHALFGAPERGGSARPSESGHRRPGQWVVLSIAAGESAARARADHVAEALEPLQREGVIDGFDALATLAPSKATRLARLAERDSLDLPSRVPALEAALRDAGFSLGSCAPALAAFGRPAPDAALPHPPSDGLLAWSTARHVAHDGGETLAATYVQPAGEPLADARARAAIASADPGAVITGFDAIDRALRQALSRDLLLVGGVALAVVALGMRLALRSARYALVAMATLACEMGVVGLAMRVLSVRWHVYDALVLPVLFGVTIDESMFLLHAARESSMAEALRTQGPLVAATALTTAAGFVALIACRFDGLRDLGAVGCIGVLAGLAAALVVVPAAATMLERSR
ncbi:MAG: MMPL family transporter, partial [Polyangiaceae bacterium]